MNQNDRLNNTNKMDEYELQEKQIVQGISKYRKNRSKELHDKIRHNLDMYYIFLDQNYASQQKYHWHSEQKKLLNQLKREKDDIVTQNVIQTSKNQSQPLGAQNQENMGKEFIKKLEEEIKIQLNRVQAGTEKAVEISTFIKLQLNKQIQALDEVYDQNVDMSHRLDRAKKGLLVILRRAMLNKLTRCLVVLLVLAVVGLIVVYILNGQGIL